jgi:hypothetical protein
MTTMVCLTLLVPQHAENLVVDALMAHDAGQVEFSMHAVHARGPLVRLSGPDDQVRGFARRVEVKLILPQAACDALLPALQAVLAGVDGGYWLTAVQGFAAFDSGASMAGAPR